ncbi:MAG TPA: hypothetical protein VFD70_27685 [Anaerolineae bacterium]|nr:hypothetical protein [Anaerolineae bacterium]
MKRVVLVLIVFALFLIACGIGSQTDLVTPASRTNPENLNTPNPNNPAQDINTAEPPTAIAPNVTPPGPSGGNLTPTVPSLNSVPPTVITATPATTPTP